MHHPTYRIPHAMTFVKHVVDNWLERETYPNPPPCTIDPTSQRTIRGRPNTLLPAAAASEQSGSTAVLDRSRERRGKSVRSWCDGSSDRSFMG